MDERERLLEEVDAYGDSVRGMLALVHELMWDEGKLRSGFDHRHGSEHVYGEGKDPVTPDMSLILPKSFAVVGDVKASFGGRQDKASIRDQLLRYDQAVGRIGAEQSIPSVGTVLLTHGTRKNDASGYFAGEAVGGRFSPERPFAIVGFMRNDQRRSFVYLEKAYGSLVPPEKDAKLQGGVSIRLEWLDESYGGIKFYDARPPACYLLEVLWDHLLPSMIPEDSYTRDDSGRPRRVGSIIAVECDVVTLAVKLRDEFSLRLLNPLLPECPRIGLLRDCLTLLVKWGVATLTSPDRYRIGWRKLRPDALEYFVRRMAKDAEDGQGRQNVRMGAGGRGRRGGAGPGQMSLFQE